MHEAERKTNISVLLGVTVISESGGKLIYVSVWLLGEYVVEFIAIEICCVLRTFCFAVAFSMI